MAEIDSQEFTYWIAHYESDHFGQIRSDMRVALNTAVTANAWRGKNTPAKQPLDYMPYVKYKAKNKTRKSDPKALEMIFRTMANGGKGKYSPGKKA